MGENQSVHDLLGRIERIELAHPNIRIVAVTLPCDLPDTLWNVEESQMRGQIPLTGKPVPNMRKGIFGNYFVHEGPFSVKFSDGTIQFA